MQNKIGKLVNCPRTQIIKIPIDN